MSCEGERNRLRTERGRALTERDCARNDRDLALNALKSTADGLESGDKVEFVVSEIREFLRGVS